MLVKLNISERLFALSFLRQFKGELDVLAQVLEDIKLFPITEEEWKKAGKLEKKFTDEKGQPATSWEWNDDNGGLKDIEVSAEVKKYLIDKIAEADEKKEFTLQDRAAISLKDKLTNLKWLEAKENKK